MLDIRRNSHRILFIMRIDKTQLTSADRKLTDRVRRKFREGIRTYHLIAPGDHVLVGLSGGKDSMALLQLLGEYRRHAGRRLRSQWRGVSPTDGFWRSGEHTRGDGATQEMVTIRYNS